MELVWSFPTKFVVPLCHLQAMKEPRATKEAESCGGIAGQAKRQPFRKYYQQQEGF
jgi:hypothetical protein